MPALVIHKVGAILCLLYHIHLTLSFEKACSGKKGCDMMCNNTSCSQKCPGSLCNMVCRDSKVCNQNCNDGGCPLMECTNSQICSANCDGGSCTNMTCRAKSSCTQTCGRTSCSMSCFAPSCTAICNEGNCNITFTGNVEGTVLCPGGNCRVKCPGPGKCNIHMCGMNSCIVSYESPTSGTTRSSGNRAGVPQHSFLAAFALIDFLIHKFVIL